MGVDPGSTNVLAPRTLTLPRFGEVEADRILARDELFAVLFDKYPVSPGHSLVVALRPVASFQALDSEERLRLLHWMEWTENHLASRLKPTPDAFNFGLNDGPAAGQTVAQFHFHIIPRYKGDVEDPRGGVRYVIPAKARYW
jgi:diadenosine tetraphosphate (Ap4A) HIT family hydrolase